MGIAIVHMITVKKIPRIPEFDWEWETMRLIETLYFIGCLISQIPGGFLAARYKANIIFGTGIGATAILHFFVPTAARLGPQCLIIVRILQGIADGVTFPASHEIWKWWAPPLDRTQLVTLALCGSILGAVVGTPVSEWLAEGQGWPAMFYFYGFSINPMFKSMTASIEKGLKSAPVLPTMLKIAGVLIASITAVLAVSSAVRSHADYLAPCNSTLRCRNHEMYCSEGVCQCPPNKAPVMLRWDLHCRGEDHPWVISNASCLSSKKTVAKSSCRHSPCYSGILVDLLRSADEDGKFLDNCTITEVTWVGQFKSGAWTNNSIMDHLAGNKTDLGLAIFNQPTLSPHVKAAVHFESILVGNYKNNVALGIAFPKSFNEERVHELGDRILQVTDHGRAGEIFDKYFLQDGPTLWKKDKQLTTFMPRRVVYWL
ncbi:Vesicular glutamate transporter 3 [Folsomia candida]|uniref:Vesicular glutamate transporter 3 n=1 Tax=Folsomia candida TaxID=158441 RepID=A0A226DMW0_FOLCA|nr:Vesicular glutamate transporter 3 [Folsomia candida]